MCVGRLPNREYLEDLKKDVDNWNNDKKKSSENGPKDVQSEILIRDPLMLMTVTDHDKCKIDICPTFIIIGKLSHIFR